MDFVACDQRGPEVGAPDPQEHDHRHRDEPVAHEGQDDGAEDLEMPRAVDSRRLDGSGLCSPISAALWTCRYKWTLVRGCCRFLTFCNNPRRVALDISRVYLTRADHQQGRVFCLLQEK